MGIRAIVVVTAIGGIAGSGAPAAADRVAIGASLGAAEDERGAEASTRGVFGRLRLVGLLSGQLEIAGSSLEDWTARRAVVGPRLDIGGRRLVPYFIAVAGGERWYGGRWYANTESDFLIAEAGGGLDLRLFDSAAIGFDLRAGHRRHLATRFTEEFVIQILPPEPPIELDGAYTSARVTATVSF